MIEKLKALPKKINHEVRVYKLLMKDNRTPKLSKILLMVAFCYAITPLDLIPNFIPVLGYIDDLIIIPILIFIAVRQVPKGVVTECRGKAAIS